MEALANKYRPRLFSDVVCQDSVRTILQNQLDTMEFKHGYLFCGGAGTGKTTSARIFANAVNEGKGKPIEIDGASNNGVDNIRDIIKDARMKSLDTKYKVYIIDEVHMLSIGAFNALLKILEEPPKGVIFILCTTDPQKIPATILSRVQRFDFKRIPTDFIFERLMYIIDQENQELIITNCGSQDAKHDINWAIHEGIPVIEYEKDALLYIAKLADGGMRDAITKLDTILGYTKYLDMENILNCLGISSYDTMGDLVSWIYQRKPEGCVQLIHDMYMNGKDLKLFIKDLSKYVLDLCKFSLTNDFDITQIPHDHVNRAQTIVQNLGTEFLVELLDTMNKLYNTIKYEQNPKSIVESEVLLLCM